MTSILTTEKLLKELENQRFYGAVEIKFTRKQEIYDR